MFVQLLSIIPYSSSSHLNVLFRSVWRVAKGSYIGGKAIFASAPLSLCSRRHRVPSSGSALTLALILVSRLGGTRVPAISFCVRQLKYAKMKVASRFLSKFKKDLLIPRTSAQRMILPEVKKSWGEQEVEVGTQRRTYILWSVGYNIGLNTVRGNQMQIGEALLNTRSNSATLVSFS